MTGLVITIVSFLVAVIAIRCIERGCDRARLRRFVVARRGTVIEIWEIHARPAAQTWRHTRVYQVRWTDELGDDHLVRCETSMRKGVYVSEAQVIQNPRHPTRARTTPRPRAAARAPEESTLPART